MDSFGLVLFAALLSSMAANVKEGSGCKLTAVLRNQNQYGVDKYGTKRYAIELKLNLNYIRCNL